MTYRVVPINMHIIQCYRRHKKAKHNWFFERYVKRYKNNNGSDAEIDQEVNPV